jgi:hypothetical protein
MHSIEACEETAMNRQSIPQNCSASRPVAPGPIHRVAIVVRHGVDFRQYAALSDRLAEDGGVMVYVLSERLGSVTAADGHRIGVDASVRRWPGSHFDCIFVLQPVAGKDVPGGLAEEVFIRNAECGGTLVLELPEAGTAPSAAQPLPPARQAARSVDGLPLHREAVRAVVARMKSRYARAWGDSLRSLQNLASGVRVRGDSAA